ncbi:MAG: hypothetical protein DIJKHBIC_00115 [Thermoanaerobaculia bacterium]|nr:hypothetical protein [Thermoanaerobaculia bacterium]
MTDPTHPDLDDSRQSPPSLAAGSSPGADPALPAPPPLDLEEVRKTLAERRGPAFWRGLEELGNQVRFREFLEQSFPQQLSEWDASLSRRRFLELSTASMALAGLTACTRQPVEKIVPYVKQPEEIVPGVPLFFATASVLGGYALGVLAESHEGRPTKLEGNPEHPASLGATDAITQAQTLGLYDPDRSQIVTRLGSVETYARFSQALSSTISAQASLEGAGLRILTETVTSPSMAALLGQVLAKFPKAKWIQYEPAGREAARKAARSVFGKPAEVRYDFARVQVAVTLDGDFLSEGPGRVRYARDFANQRRLTREKQDMARLYAAESALTNAGALADHRLAVRSGDIPSVALALASELGVAGTEKPSGLDPAVSKWVAAVAKDLSENKGKSVVYPGEYSSEATHVLAHAINTALGNVGQTVLISDPIEASPADQTAALRELSEEMAAGKVDALLILEANPVFSAPPELDFAKAMLKTGFRVHLGLYADETAEYCQWHIPAAHALETWGDARAFDGTVTILQPLIEPLYDGKSPLEILSILVDQTPRTAHDIVRTFWEGAWKSGSFFSEKPASATFDAFWRRSLHDGVVAGTALPHQPFSLAQEAVGRAAGEAKQASAKKGSLELNLRPDPSLHDGRFANNGWLQELPKPLTKIVWDNAALVAPSTAKKLGLANGQVVVVTSGKATVELPVHIHPGQAPDSITSHIGFGRKRAGRVGNGVGVNVFPIRTTERAWHFPAVGIAQAHKEYRIATTQQHFRMDHSPDERLTEILRTAPLSRYRKEPDFARKLGVLPEESLSLHPSWEYKERAWGLSVDLGSCTGCNACVVACQAENNIPIVGKEQVARGREMHWIRVDQYFEGKDPDNPEAVHHQPVMCQQCEKAPCEVVCPVAATVHSAEGLNDMVYNRCVGTRYCSNNCPYKVRRFNFLEYNKEQTPVTRMGKNPEVTVRSRGVMEKCTYCVQRINRVRIAAERENRAIRDGEIRTACQQVCPASAIVFGNINDPVSEVSRLKADSRTYWLLDELNTRPRTSYMARVRALNPELEAV